jgi:hypothetical protein
MNLGGTVLKPLYETATVADTHQLRQNLEQFQAKDADIVHSLAHQVT